MQWHLAAFEAAEADARTRRLALAAASARLADAGADAAADAHAELARPGLVLDLVQPHGTIPILKFWALLLVHNADEVGNAVDHAAHGRGILERALAVQLVETEAISVCVCLAGRRFALAICSTVTVFLVI